jgi:hypothetical protein
MTAPEQFVADEHGHAQLPSAVPVFPEALVAKAMDDVFERLKAKPVISRLKELGYSEVHAQKACLLYPRPVLETSALLNWLSFEAKPQEVDKCVPAAALCAACLVVSRSLCRVQPRAFSRALSLLRFSLPSVAQQHASNNVYVNASAQACSTLTRQDVRHRHWIAGPEPSVTVSADHLAGQ